MNEILPTPRCPVCGGMYCYRPYESPGGDIACQRLKDMVVEMQNMRMKIDLLERDNFELKVRAQTPNDIRTLIDSTINYVKDQSDYHQSFLKKAIENFNLRLETAYAVFQKIVEDNYPFLNWSFGEVLRSEENCPRLQFINDHMMDEEEHKLIAYIEKRKYTIPYQLSRLFLFERPKLSKVAENAIHDVFIERHTTNKYTNFTSGMWSLYDLMRIYKNANLGKIVMSMKKAKFEHAFPELVNTYPEAVKYIALI